MMTKYFSFKTWIFASAVLTLSNCKIPYDPPLKSTQVNALVVEGFIDGAAPITIKLSHARKLTAGDTAAFKYELNARIIIEDDHQNQYALAEAGNGFYVINYILNLNPAYQYRIHIFTSGGKEYLSDYVQFKQSPPIDTIGWKLKDNGVQVFVNTHDPNNATKYYRWEYNETWEFHTPYFSSYKYIKDNNTVVPRTEQVQVCWKYADFTTILLGSSAKLTSDVINESPLVYIPQHDQKLSVLYSIWVKQYALDLNGYNYWEAMKKNTEQVGSIFDPQPNQTRGNIHCTTDASETVVGYVGAGNSVMKRVFISNASMPDNWNIPPQCETTLVTQDSIKFYFYYRALSPINLVTLPTGVAYNSSFIECVDCTISGANKKPAFWQ